MNGTARFDGTLKEDLEGLGFTDVDIPAVPPVSFMSFRYLETELFLSNETLLGVDGTGQVLVLRAVVPEGAMGPDLEGRIVAVIELLGRPPSLWDDASRSDFSLLHAMLRPASDIDVPSVDWMEAMGTELERLVEIGLISGLDGEDARAISALSIPGAYGFKSRVFYDNRTLDWRYYDSSGLPPPVTLPEEEFDIYGDERFPQRPGDNDPDRVWALYLAASAAALIITSFLALVLFQRIDRASKLNNARRMLIFNTIKQNPGIHFSGLMKDLGLKPGVTSYHINRLEKEELIKSYQDGMYRRFYLYEDKVEMKIRLSDLQRLIIETVRSEPGISQVHISRLIGKSKVVINYHVRFLRDLGVLHLETEGRETHCFLTSQGATVPTA
jgi:DNA-binding transcriptional ArsR family regulator